MPTVSLCAEGIRVARTDFSCNLRDRSTAAVGRRVHPVRGVLLHILRQPLDDLQPPHHAALVLDRATPQARPTSILTPR
jgi:hypothetical protein